MSKQEFGDWQTPIELAESAMTVVARNIAAPSVVVEPTCGEGAFLVAAHSTFPEATLIGSEINEQYAATARARLPSVLATVDVADFFSINWSTRLNALPEPILIAGNPPWVTNAVLGSIGSENLPAKRNFKKLSGFEALTGKSNFDVSEWMLVRLLEALQGRHATIAVLCKAAVARRVIEFAASRRWDFSPGGVWRIDAMRHFRAAVDAVLFIGKVGQERRREGQRWPVYASLDDVKPCSSMAVVDGVIVANVEQLSNTAHLIGTCDPEWRSGLKHDCSRVMELERSAEGWVNGLGDIVEIEDDVIFPLLKSSDVANGSAQRERAVVVPQRALGDDTARLKASSPKAWRYLSSHRELFSARKSSIYRGQPEFAVFGVGDYSFAPWKVAISGLYKRCEFSLVGPRNGKPVMLDDTCYFLPFGTRMEARNALAALSSPMAREFFSARVFWDAKRPMNKAILQKLDLSVLLTDLNLAAPRKPKQRLLF